MTQDVVRADRRVLEVRTGLALETERLLDVEHDQLAARVLQHEVADGADRDLGANPPALVGAELRIALADFGRRLVGQQVEQIVDLHAEALAAGHFDERLDLSCAPPLSSGGS